MSKAMHYVCTYADVKQLLSEQSRFWVSLCGCRESKGNCSQSRMDLCIGFSPDAGSTSNGIKEQSREQVEAIVAEAQSKLLVPRPWRIDDRVAGICLCCSCCCAYFLNHEDICDAGSQIEHTELAGCTHCGLCIDACAFKARVMETGKLVVNQELCFGCGVCVDQCPQACISMVSRGSIKLNQT